MVTTYLSKWSQTITVSWSMYTAYRINFFLTTLGPAIVFFFVKYKLWEAIYGGDSTLVIKGYNLEQMLEYHGWVLIVGLMNQGYMGHNLAEDIRLGKISTYLIYPFDFWEFHTAGWISYQVLQTFVALITFIIIITTGMISPPSIDAALSGLILCFVSSMLWFNIQFFTGLLAFWLEETWVVRVIITIVAGFLAGAFIPLELYPEWLVSVLEYTPFPYLTFYPIKIFNGSIALPMKAIFTLLIWIGIISACNILVWKTGLKRYTAAGV